MKLHFLLSFILLAMLGKAQHPASVSPQQAEIEFKQLIFSESEYHKQSKTTLATAANVGNNYDLKYHRLEFFADPAVRFITGIITTYFTALENNTQQITFELMNDLTVDSVKHITQNLTFSHINNVVSIDLTASLNASQLDSVTVYYHGEPGNSGFGSFSVNWQNDSIPIMATLSEPYGARDWWPCKQTLNDKIDSIDVHITCPAQYEAGSNGVLVNTIDGGSYKTYHWKHRYPIAAYLIAIGISDFAIYSDYCYLPTDTIEILNYVFPQNLTYAQERTPITADFITLFDTLFGPYPFANEKYGHLQWTWGGGMEHQTMSFMGGFNFDLISHELAHQWFGDKITCGSWEDIWLNEGFATYATGLCYQYVDPFYWYAWRQFSRNNVVSETDGSVFCSDTTSNDRIFNSRLTYRKASYLLHMLRFRMGDEAFFSAIKHYLTDPALAFNYSQTENLKYYLETYSSLDLTEFFADWYYGEGHPVYNVKWTQFPSTRLVIELNQQPTHPSVSFFEGPLPVKLKNETRDTTIVLQHNTNGQIYELQPGFEVDSVIVDPEIWVLQQNTVQQIDAEKTGGIWVYPNPVIDVAQVKFDSPLYSAVRYELYNTAGQLILSENVMQGTFGGFTVNMVGLQKGVYVLTVWSTYGNNTNDLKQAVKKKIVKF